MLEKRLLVKGGLGIVLEPLLNVAPHGLKMITFFGFINSLLPCISCHHNVQ